jgi:hypothetical protein
MTDATNEGQPALTQEQKDAAAAEKYRAQQQVPEDENVPAGDADDDKPQRPDNVPEKFWDAEKGELNQEALLQSYLELEKAKSAAPAKTEGEGDGANVEGQGEGQGEDVAKTISAHREVLTEKILAGENLVEADYAPFEKVGFSKDDVDAFIAGQKALGQLIQMELHNEVGGADSYKAMTDWAKTNLKPEEIEAFNRDVVQSDDRAVNLNAVRGLYARYQLANGRDSKDPTLNAGGRAHGAGYASGAEMRADMASDRYKKDAGFRAEVARKVANSRQAGVDLSL